MLTRKEFLLTLPAAALGHLRVGLAAHDGSPIPGFGVDESVPLRTNSTHAVAEWKGQPDLAALAGREVRVVFTGVRPRLFSFRFADAP
jgi:hypothetical protein